MKYKHLIVTLVASLAVFLPFHSAIAADLTLIISPVQSPERTREIFQPLADYLAEVTGEKVTLETPLNFFTYWETIKRTNSAKQHHLVLDAAHISDYRIKSQGYTVLAKIPDVVSFSVVTGEDSFVFEVEEFIGQRVASIVSPSMGALRLSEIFTNPVRQPQIVEADSAQAAVQYLKNGEAAAAIIPTPILGSFPELNVVHTTEQAPALAMLAAPSVDARTRKAVSEALISADKSAAGRAMLAAVKLPSFEAASADVYDGYAELLEGVWGYETASLQGL